MKTEDHILNYCWNQLQSYKDEEYSNLTTHRPEQTLGWIEEEFISETEAMKLLDTWIQNSLKNLGAVYLYSCLDNAHISIEKEPPTDEELEYLDEIIPNIFYHGDD